MKLNKNLLAIALIGMTAAAHADESASVTAVRALDRTSISYGNVSSLWFDDAWRLDASWMGGSGEVRVRLEFDLYHPLLGWNSYRQLFIHWNGSADSRSLNRIFLKDRDAGWTKIGETAVGLDETSFTRIVNNPNRFILPGGGVKMRFDLRMTRQSLFRLDQAYITFVH